MAATAGVAIVAIWTKNARRMCVSEGRVMTGLRLGMDVHSLKRISNVAVKDASARMTTIPNRQVRHNHRFICPRCVILSFS